MKMKMIIGNVPTRVVKVEYLAFWGKVCEIYESF